MSNEKFTSEGQSGIDIGFLHESNVSDSTGRKGKLFESASYPNKVIRIEYAEDLLIRHDHLMEIPELIENAKRLYGELKEKYDINAPVDFQIVDDEKQREVVCVVVDKVQGSTLENVAVTPESIEEIEKLYASVARYFGDKLASGDLYLWDLNASSQYVYGTRNEEETAKIYLVDCDIWMSKSLAGLYLSVEWLSRHMSAVEKHCGKKFMEARQQIKKFVDQQRPALLNAGDVKKVEANINGIRKFLSSENLAHAPETAIPSFE